MLGTPTEVQFQRTGRRGMTAGAFLAFMKTADYYPMEEEGGEEPVNTTVQLPPDLHGHLQFIADLWNAFDKVRGLKKSKKWKPASVIRRLLIVGRDGLATQLGGIPEGEEAQAEFIETASEKLAAEIARAKPKK